MSTSLQDEEKKEFPAHTVDLAEKVRALEAKLLALRALEPLSQRLHSLESAELPAARSRVESLEGELAEQADQAEGLEHQCAEAEAALQVWRCQTLSWNSQGSRC